MDKCQECGAAALTPKSTSVGGHCFEPRAVTFCGTCGTWDGAVARYVAQNGPAKAAMFKYLIEYLRDHAGLPTNRLAALINRSPEAVYRWMGGGQTFDVCAWTVVAALVVDHVEGRRSTLGGLECLAKGKQSKRVPLDVMKRAGPDLRAQQDEQRRAILKIVDAFVRDVTSDKSFARMTERREAQRRRGNLGSPTPNPFIEKLKAEAALRPPSASPPRSDEYYGQPPEENTAVDWQWNELRSIDARLPDAVLRVGRALTDPERVRANGKIGIAARLAWEAGLEDRPNSETWDDAAKRITARYRKARG